LNLNRYVLITLLFTLQVNASDYEGKSNDELARELANPNTPLASMKFKTQYRTYQGDINDAKDQDSTTLVFQPTLPFPLDNGDTLYVRPAVPLLFDQPTIEGGHLLSSGIPINQKKSNLSNIDRFDSEIGLGDITIDVQYGNTEENGFLWSYGATATIPSATQDELGADRWALGPGFQLGHIGKKTVFGGFLNHQWDIAGSSDTDINLSTLQLFAVYLPGGGWSVASSPIMSYDHESNNATIPINLALGKTLKIKGRPGNLQLKSIITSNKPMPSDLNG